MKKVRNDLRPEIVRAALDYNPETGVFYWKPRPESSKAWNIRYSGKVAGSAASHGYIFLRLNGKRYLAHRLAWLYVTGEWPSNVIDHIDGNGLNNRWINLRSATHSQNQHNSKTPKTNKSGYKGVCYYTRNKKWVAKVTVNYKTKVIGYFDTPEEAHIAYSAAAKKEYGEFVRKYNNQLPKPVDTIAGTGGNNE